MMQESPPKVSEAEKTGEEQKKISPYPPGVSQIIITVDENTKRVAMDKVGNLSQMQVCKWLLFTLNKAIEELPAMATKEEPSRIIKPGMAFRRK